MGRRYHQLSRYGAIAKGVPFNAGRTLFVIPNTVTPYNDFAEQFPVDEDGEVRVFTSLKAAVDSAKAWDTIKVMTGGDYDDGEVINITVEGLKILGPGISNHNTALVLGSSASHHLITINANHVEIAGLGFTQTKNGYDAIRVATTVDVYKCHIHDCRFDGYGQGEYGIHTGTTYDSPDIVIENNVFRSWQTAGIYANATRDLIRNNEFIVATALKGIDYIPNAGSRPDGRIYDNRFFTADGTNAVGISVTNTPTAGTLNIDGNKFQYFADNDHCISKRTGYTNLNYLGITAIAIT